MSRLAVHPPAPDPPRRRRRTSLATRFAGVLALFLGLSLTVYVLDVRSADRLDAAMTDAAQNLLPGGRVQQVEIADKPALVVDRRDRVQRTVVHAVSGGGQPVVMTIGDYDRSARRAGSVSWRISGLPLTEGWQVTRSATNSYQSQAQREVDGHLVQVVATAVVRDDQVEFSASRPMVDSGPLSEGPSDIQAKVKPLLEPRAIPLPRPGTPASVKSAWFDAEGMGVELQTGPVDLDTPAG